MTDRKWFALRVPPGKERVATKMLAQMGCAGHVPLRHVYRRKTKFARRKTMQSYPLAPAYVFAPLDAPAQLSRLILGCHLVSAVVGFGGKPAAIPQTSMDSLLGGVEAPREHAHQVTGREYAVGDLVEVLEGPWAGWEGPVQEITDRRAKVLLTVLNHLREVTVLSDAIGRAA